MRVLMTGASGFLGSYVATDLVNRGHQVSVLLRSGVNASRLEHLADRIERVHATLGNRKDVRAAIAQARPQVVVHMAWQGVGNVHRDDPTQFRNIAPVIDLFDAAAAAGASAFVGAGSQAEYGPYDRMIRETDDLRPITLYGHAKLLASEVAARMAEIFGMRFAWLRVFSTYGPRDNSGWLIPDLIAKLRRGERPPLTRGEQRWGFLHARDAASAFRTIVESEAASGAYNVGSSEAPPLRDTVLLLRDLVNKNVELGFGDVPYRAGQVMHLQADVSRLSALGWKAVVDLESGLRETVASHDVSARN